MYVWNRIMTEGMVLATLSAVFMVIGGAVSVGLLLWKIGRWQEQTIGRNKIIHQRLDNVVDSIDVESGAIKRELSTINTHLATLNGSVQKQGERISHLEGQLRD